MWYVFDNGNLVLRLYTISNVYLITIITIIIKFSETLPIAYYDLDR